MRRRELIKRLKADFQELRKTRCKWIGAVDTTQANEQRRQILLHGLEALLPEIIEKMDSPA